MGDFEVRVLEESELRQAITTFRVAMHSGAPTDEEWAEFEGPLHLQKDQLQGFINNIFDSIKANQAAITSGALTTAASIGELLAGFVLTLFILIFFLSDGARIWRFLTATAT
ncbi:AI-2E family transporter, partial [Kibdelosporangium lantanae]